MLDEYELDPLPKGPSHTCAFEVPLTVSFQRRSDGWTDCKIVMGCTRCEASLATTCATDQPWSWFRGEFGSSALWREMTGA